MTRRERGAGRARSVFSRIGAEDMPGWGRGGVRSPPRAAGWWGVQAVRLGSGTAATRALRVAAPRRRRTHMTPPEIEK